MPLRPAQDGAGRITPAPNGVDRTYVQGLLEEVRRLKVELERLRLETKDARERSRRPDPKVQRLETENARLRDELARAREERDLYEEGVRAAIDQLRRA